MNLGNALAVTWLGLLAVPAASAQSSTGSPAKDRSQFLDLEVRVEAGGQPVADLKQAEFTVKENGKAQPIAGVEFVSAPGEPEGAGHPTWIYVAVQTQPQDFSRVRDAIEKFIEDKSRPELMISIGGSPFTNDRSQLRKYLQSGPVAQTGLPVMWETDSRLELEGSLALSRYLALVRVLSLRPGKKTVVLFRRGLSIEQERYTPRTPREAGEYSGGTALYKQDSDPARNRLLLDQLASEALRSRVNFYVGDPSALESIARQELQGLFVVAERTGGRVVYSNDLSEVFGRVLEDSANYYVVRYSPSDKQEKGRSRRISVSVNRKGVSVNAPGGYLERRPYQQMDDAVKALHLQQSFFFEAPSAGFPIRVSSDVFRAEDGKSLVIYSVGVHPAELTSRTTSKGLEMDFTVAAQVTGGAKREVLAYDQQRSQKIYPKEAIERARQDQHALIESVSKLQLDPGSYALRIIVRDERSGNVGGYSSTIDVPDLKKERAASTLLVTRRAVKPEPSEGPLGTLLDIGQYRFLPECAYTYRTGDPIWLLYDVYNVPQEMLENPPPLQIALERQKKLVDNVAGAGQGVPLPAIRAIRYAGAINTADLQPGEYTLFVRLPPDDTGNAVDLLQEFVLLPR